MKQKKNNLLLHRFFSVELNTVGINEGIIRICQPMHYSALAMLYAVSCNEQRIFSNYAKFGSKSTHYKK